MTGQVLRVAAAAVAAFFAVVVGLVAAAVAVVFVLYDQDELKRLASNAVSGALGREFVIRGEAGLDLGWVTRLHLEDIALANAEWAQTPNMVQIEAVDVAVDVGQLLRAEIVIPELRVTQPNILLEKNAEGQPNWTFGTGGNAAAQDAAPASRTSIPVIKEMTITDGRLVFRDPTVDRTATIDIATLAIRDDQPDRSVQISADGAFNDRPMRLRFTGGSWETLQAASEPYPVNIEATIADLRAKARGSITDPAQTAGFDLDVEVSGDNTANLFALTGLPLPPSPPYRFSGKAERSGDTFSFANMQGKVGDSDMGGRIALDTGGQRPTLRADITSNRLVFKDLAPFVGIRPGGPEAQAVAAQEARVAQTGKLLPDKEIDLRRLQALDADVSFRAKKIEAAEILPIESLATKLSLEAGSLRLQPAEVAVGGGVVRVFMSLYGADQPARSDIEAHLERINLKQLLKGSPFAQESAGLLGGKAKLQTRGTSVAEILGSASGDVFMVMSGGQISHLLIELAGLDIAESLGVLLGGDQPVAIRCVVADFAARDGVFTSNTLVVDTADTTIAGKGSIDMGQEAIDMTLYPVSKDFSPLTLRAPISIGGTFADPTAFPDPAEIGVDTTLKKIVNAILTPVVGLLPPIDEGVGEDSDCSRLIREARQR